ncbi:helix-turn-helix domain-containing protein [Chitinophaga vietnamensis]|uniref:helix-turn-helix domain-containing protein n=1 Tax=Chitinophaga vietnamensis TaxID=2593957 RepID=UPI001177B964|nr:helix-turn-helix domain-containing protein [Chitinophaga vietnamensis]
MKIEKFLPSLPLRPFIREIMIIESELATDSSITPDTSIVMAFRFMGHVAKKEGTEKAIIPASSITGIRKSVRTLFYEKASANLLVMFKEGGMAAFSRTPAHELFGLHVSTDNIFLSSEQEEILERLVAAPDNQRRIAIIETFLLKKLFDGKTGPDPRIDHAIQLIKQQHGIVRIKELAPALHISQDAFEKRFRALVGATPKQYASIVRLKNLINNYASYTSLTDASYEAGYFDQSHFIKDFRGFTGQTPKDFFKSPLLM